MYSLAWQHPFELEWTLPCESINYVVALLTGVLFSCVHAWCLNQRRSPHFSFVTLHEETKHNAWKKIFELRPPLPTTTFCSSKFEISSPCSHGDTSQNVPGSPVIKLCSKHNETYIATYIVRGSPYTRRLWQIRGPAHQVNQPASCQNARTRAVANVSMEKNKKISVYIDHQYTKSKKEVSRVFFLCSCHAYLPATMATAPYHGRSMLATWPTSSSHNSVSIAFQKLRSRFLCRGMIPLSIYTKK